MTRPRLRLATAMVMVMASSACIHGTPPSKLPFATSAAGAQVTLRVTGESADRMGELYAADDTGLLVRGQRLVRVRWDRIHTLDVPILGAGFDIVAGKQADAQQRRRLSRVSRFPQGLSDGVLARVLASLGQDAVEEVP